MGEEESLQMPSVCKEQAWALKGPKIRAPRAGSTPGRGGGLLGIRGLGLYQKSSGKSPECFTRRSDVISCMHCEGLSVFSV